MKYAIRHKKTRAYMTTASVTDDVTDAVEFDSQESAFGYLEKRIKFKTIRHHWEVVEVVRPEPDYLRAMYAVYRLGSSVLHSSECGADVWDQIIEARRMAKDGDFDVKKES